MLRRLKRSLVAHGVIGTLKLLALQPYLIWREREFNRKRDAAQEEFDRLNNVDTAGIVYLGNLNVVGENVPFGTRYGPTPLPTFEAIMKEVSIGVDEFTFVDFGSGKGPVLLYAAKYPFRKIMGVEFAPELHEIAQRNIATFLSKNRVSAHVEAVCADASTYPIPEGPVLLYFSAPFGSKVMSKVLKNVAASCGGGHRNGYIAYNYTGHFPDVDDLLASKSWLNLVSDKLTYRIYSIEPDAAELKD